MTQLTERMQQLIQKQAERSLDEEKLKGIETGWSRSPASTPGTTSAVWNGKRNGTSGDSPVSPNLRW